MSDEYTPTTEQVRAGYAHDPESEYYDPLTDHAAIHGREFDRWLAEHDREAFQRAVDTALDWSQKVTDDDERIAYYLRLGAQSVWFRLQEELRSLERGGASDGFA